VRWLLTAVLLALLDQADAGVFHSCRLYYLCK
jgi:hypothetical protein